VLLNYASILQLFPQSSECSPVAMNSFSWERQGVLKTPCSKVSEDSSPSDGQKQSGDGMEQVLKDGSVLCA
jgi:hypothetical protein